ncbi:DNA (cytosine-5)-methyltransferase 2 [Acorus calamus]|uniref:DNA (cytosine-5-)-methyltransferase n=1 Tax=Acorus calamus TaxID=4465 RepID=A0AAV9CZU0_ACOCL|nr:DNA (cytosine-5)-methyltransferase 2 [Acorus calamus]
MATSDWIANKVVDWQKHDGDQMTKVGMKWIMWRGRKLCFNLISGHLAKIMLHHVQDHVLIVRENARLQGFPDCYKFFGPMKEHYIQIGIDPFLLLVSLDAPSEWPTEV